MVTPLLKNSKVILFDLDYTLFNTDRFKKSNLKNYSLYIEVESVLQELSAKAILGIFSEGEDEFQRLKIKKTALKKYFSPRHIHVVATKEQVLTKVFFKYHRQSLYLVDDKLNILYLAKRVWPEIKTIWVKRGKYALNQKPIKDFMPDIITTNLKKLKKLAV